MSKTLGNVITPKQLIDKFGVDATRYLLLSAFPFGEDGDFDMNKLVEKYNADLANGVGNLVSRFIKVIENRRFPLAKTPAIELPSEFTHALDTLDFYGALRVVNEYVKKADQSISIDKIWTYRTNEQAVIEHLAVSSVVSMEPIIDKTPEPNRDLWVLLRIAGLLRPFMPNTAAKIEQAIHVKNNELIVTSIGTLFQRL